MLDEIKSNLDSDMIAEWKIVLYCALFVVCLVNFNFSLFQLGQDLGNSNAIYSEFAYNIAYNTLEAQNQYFDMISLKLGYVL